MGTPSTVCVHNDLATGQSSVRLGTSNDEAARGLEMVDRLGIQVLLRNDHTDDLLEKVRTDLLGGNILRVLQGDDHSVDTHGHAGALDHAVFTSHLKALVSLTQHSQQRHTCVLESGLAQARPPLRLSSAILALSLCARTTVSGMHSSVSSVA